MMKVVIMMMKFNQGSGFVYEEISHPVLLPKFVLMSAYM